MNPVAALRRFVKIGIYLALSVVAVFLSLIFSNRASGHRLSIGNDLIAVAHADVVDDPIHTGEGGEGSGGEGEGEGDGEGGGSSSGSK